MKLSVITPTYNAMKFLPSVVECLRNQTDKDFEWVVCDGSSTDGTLSFLNNISDLNIKLISQEDFGIYDALNRGVKACSGEYYLFLGVDDIVYPGAIKKYKSEISEGYDLITARITVGGSILSAKKKMSWYYGHTTYISGFSVGVICRKTLHDEIGYYSNKYPIAADQDFILKAINKGASIKYIDDVVGEFTLNGVSSIDYIGNVTELYRAQVGNGAGMLLQTMLLILRLFYFYIK